MRRFKVPPSFIAQVVIPTAIVGGAVLLAYLLTN